MTIHQAKMIHHLLTTKSFTIQELPLVAELSVAVQEVLDSKAPETPEEP